MTPRIVRRALAAAGLLLAGSALALSGCAKAKGTVKPNVPPETFIFVTSNSPSPVNHVVRLHWYGSDIDGDVVAFDLRLLNPSRPADSAWTRIVTGPNKGYDSLFTIYTPTGTTMPVFEVRAIDNAGAADPEPARETFTFTNGAPIVAFLAVPALTDTTIGTVTAQWGVSDPDGSHPPLYRVWLNSDPTIYDSTTSTTFTVPSARFYRAGNYFTGRCTLNVQALDDGGRLGPVASTIWTVRAPTSNPAAPRGRLLIIDDVPSNSFTSTNFSIDSIYANTAARNLPAGSYSVLRLQFSKPFRSASDLAQTFRLFDAVVWYRGFETSAQTLFQNYPDTILAYSQQGGRLYIEAQYLMLGTNALGWMPERVVSQYMKNSTLDLWNQPNPPDSSAGWAVLAGRRARSSAINDSIQFAQTSIPIPQERPGVRAFTVIDTSDVLFWAMPGAMDPANADPLPIALNLRQPGGGRLQVLTFPLRNTIPTGGAAVTPPSRLLAKILFDPMNGLFAP